MRRTALLAMAAAAAARGAFTATVSPGRAPRLAWRLTFGDLTGPALQAHVHLGRPGAPGPVAVTVCAPCSSGARGSVAVPPAVRAALRGGAAHVNVHTARNPAGEVRGRLSAG